MKGTFIVLLCAIAILMPIVHAANCQVDIAIIMDFSGSIHDDQMEVMKTAFGTFTNNLIGSNATVGLVKFGYNGVPMLNYTSNFNQATAVINAIDPANRGVTPQGYRGGETNWHAGFQTAQNNIGPGRPGVQKVYLFATDGDPNLPNSGNPLQIAISDSQAIQATGTIVLGLGFGEASTNSGYMQNIKNISTGGQVVAADYNVLLNTLRNIEGTICGQALPPSCTDPQCRACTTLSCLENTGCIDQSITVSDPYAVVIPIYLLPQPWNSSLDVYSVTTFDSNFTVTPSTGSVVQAYKINGSAAANGEKSAAIFEINTNLLDDDADDYADRLCIEVTRNYHPVGTTFSEATTEFLVTSSRAIINTFENLGLLGPVGPFIFTARVWVR